MRISKKLWRKYILMQHHLTKKAATEMALWIEANGFDNMQSLVGFSAALVTKYGEAAAAYACEMYDAIALASGVIVPPAVPAPIATFKETAKAVYGTAKTSQISIPQTVGRLVKTAAADTTLINAQRDRAQFAWVPSGDTCSFCITLASRGWQYVSKKTMKKGHAEHIHSNCDCQYAIRFNSNSYVEGYDPETYLEQYESASNGKPNDKINAMRRKRYAERREEINAQHREAYARRKEADENN